MTTSRQTSNQVCDAIQHTIQIAPKETGWNNKTAQAFLSTWLVYPYAVVHTFKGNYKKMLYCQQCQLTGPVLLKPCTLSPLSVMQVWCKLNYRANISRFTSHQPEQCRAAFSWNPKPREFFPNGINCLDCRVKMEHKNSPHSYTTQPASAKSPVFILLGWRPVHHRPLKE